MDNLPEIDRLLLSRATGSAADANAQLVEALVAAYRAGLYRLACSILRDTDEAEDAVQATFLRAALSLGRYTPGSNFKAWLFTIAVNVCRGLLRKRKAQRALARLLGLAENRPGRTGGPEERLIQDEAAHRLWAAVERLDEKHRLVVVLRFEGGMSIAEVAQVLAIPEKTVYSRLYEAFRRLRRELAESQPVEDPGTGLWEALGRKERAG
jgi:RNA polymerase sigma-70 factor (ECF subfamily)